MSEHDRRPGFFSGAIVGAATVFIVMWRRKAKLRATNRALRRREVRVEGSTCFLGGVETDCEEIVRRIKPGQHVRLDATGGSEGVVDDLVQRLQDANIVVSVISR